MLVLTRRRGQSIAIGQDVTVTVINLTRNEVRLGIEAPDEVRIQRVEIMDSEERC